MGRKSVHIYGYSADTDSGAGDIWPVGGAYSFPASAITTRIVSADDTDAADGQGARTVRISGLDSSYYEIGETATLSGTDSVDLTNSYLRINEAYVATAGTGGVNAGAITIGSSDTTTIAYIPASEGRLQQAIYTVPADYPIANIISWYAATYDSAGSQTVSLQIRPPGGAWQTIDKVLIGANGSRVWAWEYDTPYQVQPKTDIRLSGNASTNDNIVWGGFDLELKSNG